mmetsp:Transcript_3662/g.5564  ORF Transcript_3662/g.5564 Transcript_3662/m.5564 type:complete len:98 (+) Transcript_3662:1592-1885(+)
MPQIVALSEALIQVYECKGASAPSSVPSLPKPHSTETETSLVPALPQSDVSKPAKSLKKKKKKKAGGVAVPKGSGANGQAQTQAPSNGTTAMTDTGT